MQKTKLLVLFLVSLLFVLGNKLSAQVSQNISKLGQWDDVAVPGNFFGDRYNEVWGFVQNGREYAVIGSTWGTHFIDVTDPANPQEVDFVAGAYQGDFVIHRDYHDYNGYLYMVCDEGPSTLQIADLSTLPDSVHVVYDSDNLFQNCHNIFIDSSSALLYVCSAKRYSGNTEMEVYSLANPSLPAFVHAHTGFTSHDVFVRNDTVYQHAETNGMFVFDYGIPTAPVSIGALIGYPDRGYNHSGWLSESGDIYAFADEDHGYDIKICDVSDLSNITVVSTVNSGIDPDSSMPHNLMLKDDFMYVSYYNDGFYVYDIHNPAQPILTGYYDTYPGTTHVSYKGAWGVYAFLPSGNILIGDMSTGLYIFDVSLATGRGDEELSPEMITLFPNPASHSLHIVRSGKPWQNETYTITDLTGKTIQSGRFQPGKEQVVSTQNLDAGIYLFTVVKEGEVSVTEKIQILPK